MFHSFDITSHGPNFTHLRCICGLERPITQKHCPCGRQFPTAMQKEDTTWLPFLQFHLETYRAILKPEALNQLPPDARDGMRRHLQEEIRQLEDGTWIKNLKATIAHQKSMLEKAHRRHLDPAQLKAIEQVIKLMEEKLEAAQAS